MSNGEDNTNLLVSAIGELSRHGRSIADNQVFEVSPDDAIELVFSSRAKLSDRQRKPPQGVLDRLVQCSLHLDCVGPVTLDEAVLAKFEEKALGSGVRRTIVEGQALEWLKGRAAARRRFQELQTELVEPVFSSVLSSLQTCLKTKQESSQQFRFHKKISLEEEEAKGLVHATEITGRVFAGSLYENSSLGAEVYYQLTPIWRRFHTDLKAFEDQLSQGFKECLETGRILSVEDTPSGATLLAPFLWEQAPPSYKTAKTLQYVMARDLPGRWYRAGRVLKGKERERFVTELARKLEQLYLTYSPRGLKLRKETFVEKVLATHKCKRSLAHSAWRDAHIPHWKERGRVTDERVGLRDLRKPNSRVRPSGGIFSLHSFEHNCVACHYRRPRMTHRAKDYLLTRQEVETQFGIRKRYLEVADLKGDGPRRIVIGRLVRYREQDIREWIEAHAQDAGQVLTSGGKR